jgi:hypothetical protein
MNSNTQSQVAKLDQRLAAMAANGTSVHFSPGQVSETTPEAFAREANTLLDAVGAGEFVPFKFNDSPALKS